MNRCFALVGGGLAACVAVSASPAHSEAAASTNAAATGERVEPELFGTNALRIAASRFGEDWERARRESVSPRMRNLIRPAANVTREQQIAYVQKAVTRQIGWRSDATQWGRHDYWASADETLSRGLGDGEDRAIVKMQALRMLGFSSRDLFLTLGRDAVAGPQAILIVRLRNRYLVLDDNGSTPFTPDKRPEFTPALTFTYGAFWAHMSKGASSTVGIARIQN
jgi:predicted transglutaminase-like cysteine proteinase